MNVLVNECNLYLKYILYYAIHKIYIFRIETIHQRGFLQPSLPLPFSLRSSHPVWPDGKITFLTFGHSQHWTFAQYNKNLAKSVRKFSQILNQPFKNAKYFNFLSKYWNIAKPGHIASSFSSYLSVSIFFYVAFNAYDLYEFINFNPSISHLAVW